jgi:hypothetical protein
MNDLDMVRTLVAKPDPSPDVIDRGRHQLQQAARGPVRKRATGRRRRASWLASGVSLSAAAAVTAVVVALSSGTTSPHTGQVPPLGANASGQQILLAAATVAQTRPANSGTYWHLVAVFTMTPNPAFRQETWTRQDGTSWLRYPPPGNEVVPDGESSFSVGAASLTYAQIQQLPTDPAKLTAWIADSFAHNEIAPRPAAALPGDTAVALATLLAEVPARPAVRAAALRALAALPNVKSLGPVAGGQGLLISVPPPPADKFPGGNLPAGAADGIKLVVDLATSQLRSMTWWQGAETIVKAEWTNALPKVTSISDLHLPPKTSTKSGKK